MLHDIVPVVNSGLLARLRGALQSAQAFASWRRRARDDLPESVQVRVTTSEAVLRFGAELRYVVSNSGCGVALFDLSAWPAKAYLGVPDRGDEPKVRGGLLRYPLFLSRDDRVCIAEFHYQWTLGGAFGTVRSLDQLLPRILLSRYGLQKEIHVLPRYRVTVAPEGLASITTVVQCHSPSGEGATEVEHDVTLWAFAHPVRQTVEYGTPSRGRSAGLLVDRELLEHFSDPEIAARCDLISEIAALTSKLMACNIPEPVLVYLRRSEHEQEVPGLVLLSERELESGDRYSLAYETARQIAAMVWGVACRVHGRHGSELEDAIGTAVATCAADKITGECRTRLMRNRLLARSVRAAPLQPWQRLLRMKEHRAVYLWAHKMLEVATGRSDHLYGKLTSMAWGRSLRADLILKIAYRAAEDEV